MRFPSFSYPDVRETRSPRRLIRFLAVLGMMAVCPAQATSDDIAADTASAPAAVQNAPPDTTAPREPAKDDSSGSQPAIWDFRGVERRALAAHPMLEEHRLQVDLAREKLRDVKMAALLPKFEMETGVGPAPGIRESVDSTSLSLFDGTPIYQSDKEFNFSEWGPFYGVEFKVAQPLNVGRYRAGKRAAELQVKVSEAEYRKELLAVSREAQELYWQRVYAQTLFGVLRDAKKELDKAQRRLADKLDDMDPSVKQTDLLELKAGRFALDKGYVEAQTGIRRATLGLAFLLADTAGHSLAIQDSVILTWPPEPPPLDTLKLATLRFHPDLSRLRNGLAARRELMKVAQGELGPDIFLFGSFKYTKAWSSDRQGSGGDPFAPDPLNDLDGVAGLGFRLKLNFWQRYQKLRKEKLELKKLEAVEVYAVRGLLLKVEDAYEQLLEAQALVRESQKALRAAESWLKGAAIQYDLDPGSTSQIIAPFKASLTAKRDFYGAVLKHNLAFASLLEECGWTLTDYFGRLAAKETAVEPFDEE